MGARFSLASIRTKGALTRYVSTASLSSNAAGYLNGLSLAPHAALSLRKMVNTAANAIRVRRSSDNIEQDIGFSGTALDTTSLASFIGSNSAFVTKVYDQSGNGFDAVQATAANQPRIVNAGVYDGKIVFDGSNDFLKITSLTQGAAQVGIYTKWALPYNGTKVALESSANVSSNAGAFLIYTDASGLPTEYNAAMGVSGSQRLNAFAHVAAGAGSGALVQNTTLFDQSITGSGEIKLWNGGTSVSLASAFNTVDQTSTFSTYDLFIGARSGPTLAADMWLESLVLYNADTASLRTSIEALIA